jgi:hypothetical protein
MSDDLTAAVGRLERECAGCERVGYANADVATADLRVLLAAVARGQEDTARLDWVASQSGVTLAADLMAGGVTLHAHAVGAGTSEAQVECHGDGWRTHRGRGDGKAQAWQGCCPAHRAR